MKKYITTAIPYLNARPHIGHAMDYLLADVWARHETIGGHEVRMSAGADEHGTKVEQKAREAGVSPQQFVDDLAPTFRVMIAKLNVGVTDYVRTSDPEHARRCQEIWRRLDAAGVIYKSKYQGWYCSGCESFVTETEARAMDYQCPDHQKPLEKVSEENYYLRVSKFTDQIREFVRTAVVPEFRGREILELIKDGAQDVSISRPLEKLAWGVPVPDDDAQVMYVWVDALSNYITALSYPDDDFAADFWPAHVQVVGKDILRFHAIIWPAMLLALGLKLPRTLLAHGFINVDNTKMSKSLGNVVDPIELVEQYGVDAVRYFFLRHIPTFEDGDYTTEKFIAAYNGELANDLGNLVSRLANMIDKYDVPSAWRDSQSRIAAEVAEFHKFMKKFEYHRALETIWTAVQSCNRYIDETKPWALAKTDSAEMAQVLNVLWGDIMIIQALLTPFLPDAAAKIRAVFDGDTVQPAPILFPKVDI
ncbi:MAG: methionine--tRNA ligase [Candidatus Nomurabacteria bacterium]|jgi:methionyl-tRNA synthetase|nr:methionine--tRNA ligase [Candidatus Nomurabacteria bacterium]